MFVFDRKTVSVTKKYIITNHLTIIGMILMKIRFHYHYFPDFVLFVANFLVIINALSRKV